MFGLNGACFTFHSYNLTGSSSQRGCEMGGGTLAYMETVDGLEKLIDVLQHNPLSAPSPRGSFRLGVFSNSYNLYTTTSGGHKAYEIIVLKLNCNL